MLGASQSASLDLEIHRRCFSAVLFNLILDLLPFIERAQSSALNSGDMDKHVPAATALRLNESVALGWIEPLHRAACHFDLPLTMRRYYSGFVAWQPRRLSSCAHLDFGACPPWSRRRRKGRIEWPGYQRGTSDAPGCPCPHVVTCAIYGRADRDAR